MIFHSYSSGAMANLEALIEAAKYVECKRGEPVSGLCHRDSLLSDGQDIDNGDRSLISFRRRPGGAGTRETHNKLEKFRRAHLKECFERLRQHVPTLGSRKASNLCILKEALNYIEFLKEKDKKFEAQREKLMKCHKCLVERIRMFEDDVKRDDTQQPTIATTTTTTTTATPSLCPSKEQPVVLAYKSENNSTSYNHGGVYVCVLTKRADMEEELSHKDVNLEASNDIVSLPS